MCYNAQYLTKRVEKYAERYGIPTNEIDPLIRIAGKNYHVSGFVHPLVPAVILSNDAEVQLFNWGIIPSWTRGVYAALQIRNKTLNARSETIFTLPSFKESVLNKRCVLMFDGFFEHHHLGSGTFPYHITRADNDCMSVAGIWSEWSGLDNDGRKVGYKTVAVVTTEGNRLMTDIHNNPKIKEARMPVILEKDEEEKWLKGDGLKHRLDLIELFKPKPSSILSAKTVRHLSGKHASPNSEKALEEYVYPVIGLPNY